MVPYGREELDSMTCFGILDLFFRHIEEITLKRYDWTTLINSMNLLHMASQPIGYGNPRHTPETTYGPQEADHTSTKHWNQIWIKRLTISIVKRCGQFTIGMIQLTNYLYSYSHSYIIFTLTSAILILISITSKGCLQRTQLIETISGKVSADYQFKFRFRFRFKFPE